MANGLVRYHAERDEAGGGSAEGIQTGRGNFRAIPDRAGLNGHRKVNQNAAATYSRHQNGKETQMTRLTRRSLLSSSLGIVAAGTLARPYIANAAATTATVWWAQG